MSLEIRHARPEDLQRVAEMLRDLWEDEGCDPSSPMRDVIPAHGLLRVNKIGDTHILPVVAILDNAIAGCILCCLDPVVNISRPSGLKVVHGGSKVALALMDFCLQFMRDCGCATIECTVSLLGKRGSRIRRYYEHLGLRPSSMTYTGNVLDGLDGVARRLKRGKSV